MTQSVFVLTQWSAKFECRIQLNSLVTASDAGEVGVENLFNE